MIGDALLTAAARQLQRAAADARRATILDPTGRVWPGVVTRTPPATLEPGVPVVFFHGFGSDAATWLDIMGKLRGERDLLAVDLPGFGRNRIGDPATLTPTYYTDAAASLITELTVRWGQPPILVGRSLGGMVAGLVASAVPTMVRAILLISPAGIEVHPPTPFWEAVSAGENPLIPTNAEAWKRMVELVYYQPPRIPGFLRRQAIRIARRRRAELQTAFDALLSEGFNPLGERLRDLACPTYVIWGAHDRVLAPESLQIIRRELPGAVTEILPECGHSPTREQPERVMATLRRVLVAYG